MSGFFFLLANQPTSQPTLQEKRDPQSLGHCRRAAPRRSSKEGKEEREKHRFARVSHCHSHSHLGLLFYLHSSCHPSQVKSSQNHITIEATLRPFRDHPATNDYAAWFLLSSLLHRIHIRYYSAGRIDFAQILRLRVFDPASPRLRLCVFAFPPLFLRSRLRARASRASTGGKKREKKGAPPIINNPHTS